MYIRLGQEEEGEYDDDVDEFELSEEEDEYDAGSDYYIIIVVKYILKIMLIVGNCISFFTQRN